MAMQRGAIGESHPALSRRKLAAAAKHRNGGGWRQALKMAACSGGAGAAERKQWQSALAAINRAAIWQRAGEKCGGVE